MSTSNISVRRRPRRLSKRSILAGESKVFDKAPVHTPKQILKVFDEDGNDVTPLPIHPLDPGSMPGGHSRIFASETPAAATPDFLSSLFQTTDHASFAGPFTRSVFGSSTVSRSSLSSMQSLNDEIEDQSSKRDVPISLLDGPPRRVKMVEEVDEAMLNDVVHITLSETDTMSHLDMSDVSVAVDADDADAVRERSKVYAELCSSRFGNEKYVERGMQTFNEVPKSKAVQSDRIVMADAATNVTKWDMYGANYGGEQGAMTPVPDPDKGDYPDDIITTSRAPGTMSLLSTADIDPEPNADPMLILQSEMFKHSLTVMERAVIANILQPNLAAYRQLPVLKDPDREVTPGEDADSSNNPSLALLFTFSCELTAGHAVNCIAWHKENRDLLAVGYGEVDNKEQNTGLICCWSIKNPMWPGRVFQCKSVVTALDFSATNPRQLAVGMYDGTIAVYDTYSPAKAPVMGSSTSDGHHTSAVWQLRWIEEEKWQDKGETLVSVSADGRVLKWFLGKDLNCRDLMVLKKTHGGGKGLVAEAGKETIMSNLESGLCFDFHPTETNIYLVGTEEGYIHKCTSLNSEQYLETYTPNMGAVCTVAWSPLCPDVFLSGSGKWTVHLWRQGVPRPALSFSSRWRAVAAVAWSPKWATVFGVAYDDKVEIWDLGSSILEPVAVNVADPGVKFTAALFAEQTDCILVGDSRGRVGVYLLRDISVGDGSQVEKLEDIINANLARHF